MKKESEVKVVADIAPLEFKNKKTAVNQFDLTGKFIETHESMNAAAMKTGTNYGSLYLCVKGKAKSANKFQWRKAE